MRAKDNTQFKRGLGVGYKGMADKVQKIIAKNQDNLNFAKKNNYPLIQGLLGIIEEIDKATTHKPLTNASISKPTPNDGL